ncbi:Os05g0428850 [Oryza sativa Japonica Group]|jgi:hypothetical protein|uniref:Os05g0428850 protein n=1 Tax=Oryza sativa subsp. japonica TaxID=39947 RepID=A0A0P0WMJ7_ORYSJ|nr:Os05g0428850 [Oryza sativa Japonica Group]
MAREARGAAAAISLLRRSPSCLPLFSPVAGAPAHELGEAYAVRRALGLHVPGGDGLLRRLHRRVEPERAAVSPPSPLGDEKAHDLDILPVQFVKLSAKLSSPLIKELDVPRYQIDK